MTTLAASHPGSRPASTTASTSASTAAPTAARPAEARSSALRIQAFTAAVILAAFTAFSLWVIAGHGYTGFLTLAGREPWALQMLIDLTISLAFALGWLRADARKRGIAAWPYFVATLFLGAIGVLAYVVRRGMGAAARPAA